MQRIDGRYAWNAQCAGNMRSIIPFKAIKVYFEKQFKRKNPKTAKQFGFYAWNAQCDGNMRSIILNKKYKNGKVVWRNAWNAQCVGNMN